MPRRAMRLPRFGHRCRQALRAAGLDQTEAARRIGCHRNTIAAMCNGQVPTGVICMLFADLVNVSMDELLPVAECRYANTLATR